MPDKIWEFLPSKTDLFYDNYYLQRRRDIVGQWVDFIIRSFKRIELFA